MRTSRTWVAINESAAEISATIIIALSSNPNKLRDVSDLLVAHLAGTPRDEFETLAPFDERPASKLFE